MALSVTYRLENKVFMFKNSLSIKLFSVLPALFNTLSKNHCSKHVWIGQRIGTIKTFGQAHKGSYFLNIYRMMQKLVIYSATTL